MRMSINFLAWSKAMRFRVEPLVAGWYPTESLFWLIKKLFFPLFFIWFHPNMIPNDAKQNNPPRIWSQIWPPLVMAGEIPSFSRDRPVPSYAVRNGSHLFDLSMISPELKVRRPKCADLLWVHSEFLKHRHVSHGKLSLCWFVMGPILSYVSS